MRKYVLLTMLTILTIMLSGCAQVDGSKTTIPTVQDPESVDKGYTIRETSLSPNGRHQISTFVTRSQGMGIVIDEDELYYDDLGIRYRPSISNRGSAAWIQHVKGSGYDVMLDGESILHSGACLDYMVIGDLTGVVIESDNVNKLTRLYLIDTINKSCECIHYYQEEYIEETCLYAPDKFGIIVSCYDAQGTKLYNCYCVDGNTKEVNCIVEGSLYPISFPIQDNANDILIDEWVLSDNERFLYNALRIEMGGWNEAFAYGNDYRGRMSWSESQRLRGLCELYNKTNDGDMLERIHYVVDGILLAENKKLGIADIADEWNPDLLWAQKVYSIENETISILVNNAEILSSLLYACNEGYIDKESSTYAEIIAAAEQAYDYYDQWYDSGHYYFPYKYPMSFDGIVVPWNYQNSMADVALGLYIETNDSLYIDRCNELILSFQNEWVENDNRIMWHYWPDTYYKGWGSDDRSVNTPMLEASDDTLYEDCSHAGITIRLLCRYQEKIPDGVVRQEDTEKIQNNMNNFCFQDGFSRFISGDTEYLPKAWHYWISPYYSYLRNSNFEKYVCQGYLHCFPEWDSQESLFANAKYYDPSIPEEKIVVNRRRLDSTGNYINEESFKLSRQTIKEFIHNNYPSLMQ